MPRKIRGQLEGMQELATKYIMKRMENLQTMDQDISIEVENFIMEDQGICEKDLDYTQRMDRFRIDLIE